MAKFYVGSGDLKTVIARVNSDEAVIAAIQKASEDHTLAFGEFILVSEKGHELSEDDETATLYLTEMVLAQAGLSEDYAMDCSVVKRIPKT